MPLVKARRIVLELPANDSLLQTVGDLVFLSDTEIVLDGITQAGTYSVIEYSSFAGGQNELNQFVTFSLVNSTGRSIDPANTHGTNNIATNRITVRVF
jgi:hypothetical protein